MPGARQVVHAVMQAGLTPVLVTGSGQPTLLNRLNENFPDAFRSDRMITAHDVLHGKPHPEPYLRGLEKAGVAPNEAIVIENAPLGVRSAAAAGIFTIAVNTGPLSEQLLYQEGAQIVLPDMSALAESFDNFVHLCKETHLR